MASVGAARELGAGLRPSVTQARGRGGAGPLSTPPPAEAAEAGGVSWAGLRAAASRGGGGGAGRGPAPGCECGGRGAGRGAGQACRGSRGPRGRAHRCAGGRARAGQVRAQVRRALGPLGPGQRPACRGQPSATRLRRGALARRGATACAAWHSVLGLLSGGPRGGGAHALCGSCGGVMGVSWARRAPRVTPSPGSGLGRSLREPELLFLGTVPLLVRDR